MLTIRLTRVGKKNDPSFRVIVVESKRKPQPGNYLENVGSYDPRQNRVELKGERIKHWISMGATVSDTVLNLLVSQKIIDAKKINILPAFKKAEEKPAPAPEAASEPAAETPIEEAAEEVAVTNEAPAEAGDNEVVEEKATE